MIFPPGVPVALPPLVPDAADAENHSPTSPDRRHSQSLRRPRGCWRRGARGAPGVRGGRLQGVPQGAQHPRDQMQRGGAAPRQAGPAGPNQPDSRLQVRISHHQRSDLTAAYLQTSSLAVLGDALPVAGQTSHRDQALLERVQREDHLGQEGQQG